MMKFNNINRDQYIKRCIDRMEKGEIEAFVECAQSDIPVLNINSITLGALHHISDERYINLLKNKLCNSSIKFFGIEMREYAKEALEQIGIN